MYLIDDLFQISRWQVLRFFFADDLAESQLEILGILNDEALTSLDNVIEGHHLFTGNHILTALSVLSGFKTQDSKLAVKLNLYIPLVSF